jgi:hypothetical protein
MDDIIDIDPQGIINANATSSGAADLANQLLVTLTEGVDFEIPDVDIDDDIFDQPEAGTGPLYDPIQKIDVKDFTTGIVGGEGIFDQIMVSLVAHLKIEYTANRISGAEYSKAYIAAISAGLQTATTLLLESDKAYWAAVLAQQQAQMAEVQKTTARVQLEVAKAQLIQTQYEALNAEAQYGLTKMQISVQDAAYAQQVAQTEGQVIQNANLTKQGVALDFTNTQILPAQLTLTKEQAEVQRANTLDTRTDGSVVKGAVGKQKDLHAQQITSFMRDAETKLVKLYTDNWIAQRTTIEDLLPPDQFTNANINEVLVQLRGNLNLGS